ncbi:hypothetical protein KIW84_065140 [Lathyrus oleraceus]|uniref:CCHC-type domain-containing protein n=1 Tax=Pisum sativum TaxID=3888 RepID=A0A9D4WEL0_PEA|nr:hypothetical protein KIW84_065140 [Pisum sativum]
MASTSGTVKVGKYEIEKFNEKNDFSYWRMQMKNLLISQKLHKALAGKEQKPVSMKDEDWEELDLEARAAIILCLERDVAFLYENLVQTLMLMGDTLTMDETRTSLLADDLRKIATSGMSGNGGENNEQAQGLFASRGRNNQRSNGRGGKSRSKSRAHAERTCFKCGELGHFKANCPNKRILFKNYTNNENNSRGKQKDLQEASYVSNGEDDCFSVSEQDHDISRRWMLDSGASHHMDVTFDEKSMVPNDGDVKISNQVIEIESEDQPDSSRGQVENPIASEDEEEDEHDHEEVQEENTHVLQQQQQESLETTRPKRNYKIVQKFGSDKPLRHYGQRNSVLATQREEENGDTDICKEKRET